MLRRTLYALLVYIFGAFGLLYWSLAGFNAGASREDWALMIVLPAAWIVSFWPSFGALVVIWQVRNAQGLLARLDQQFQAEGGFDASDLRELEEFAVKLAARENRLPEFIVRPFVRKAITGFAARRGGHMPAGQPASTRSIRG